MESSDILTIERDTLYDILDTFRLMINAYPEIVKRETCLDRKIMVAYNKLADIYNGEKFDFNKFSDSYFNSNQIPTLKEELR